MGLLQAEWVGRGICMAAVLVSSVRGDLATPTAAMPKAATAAGSISFPVLWNEDVLYTRTVAYADGKNALTGFLAFYNNTVAQRPVVMIVPDADGIGDYERWRAKLFAAMGYIGFVVDVYGDKVKQGAQMPLQQRSTLTRMYANNQDQYKGRLMTGLNKMRNLTLSNGKVVAVGYSFGGSGAVQLLRAWPDSDGLAGVVSFHGLPLWAKNFTPTIQGCPIRVAIFNGVGDIGNNEEDLVNFRTELDTAGVSWQWMDFGKTVSGFSQPDLPLLQSADQAIAYNPQADTMSWFALRGFLLDVFGFINPQNKYTAAGFVADYSTGFTGFAPPATAGGSGTVSSASAALPGV